MISWILFPTLVLGEKLMVRTLWFEGVINIKVSPLILFLSRSRALIEEMSWSQGQFVVGL